MPGPRKESIKTATAKTNNPSRQRSNGVMCVRRTTVRPVLTRVPALRLRYLLKMAFSTVADGNADDLFAWLVVKLPWLIAPALRPSQWHIWPCSTFISVVAHSNFKHAFQIYIIM